MIRVLLWLLIAGCSAGLSQPLTSADAENQFDSLPSPHKNETTEFPPFKAHEETPQPDKQGLQDLISKKSHSTKSSKTSGNEIITASSRNPNPRVPLSPVVVPPASELWQMEDSECRDILTSAHIQTHPPDFQTPFVRTPLLLDSPIEGVIIDTKWPSDAYRRVMDCRLIVALIQLARRAREQGVVKIEYYSTWRPIKPPSGCAQKKQEDKCRNVYERAQTGHLPSQHSRATAIDIRWFTFEDNSVVDVLTHYEMNFHEPPCDDHPITAEGRFLRDFVCSLHDDKAFNVMLTPNADRDHANHFHFDITPNVKWYIVR